MEITDLNAFEMLSSKIRLLSKKVDENAQLNKESLRDWKTPEETCAILHIKPRTLQSLRTSGKLPYSQMGKKIYYRSSEILKLIGAKQSQPNACNI